MCRRSTRTRPRSRTSPPRSSMTPLRTWTWRSAAATSRRSPSSIASRVSTSIGLASGVREGGPRMSSPFFGDVRQRIRFGGPDSGDPLTYAAYQPERVVRGRPMAEQLRIAVCLWHSFNWPGSDVFGVGTFDRPWLAPGADAKDAMRTKLEAAFEFIEKLGVPFFTFHDRDVAPEGKTWTETRANLDASVALIEEHMART